jgi:hypothetical protein
LCGFCRRLTGRGRIVSGVVFTTAAAEIERIVDRGVDDIECNRFEQDIVDANGRRRDCGAGAR